LGSEIDFALVISSDEPLLRRMNDIEAEGAESVTVSTGRRGTDARWRLDLDAAPKLANGVAHDDEGIEEERAEQGRPGMAVVRVLESFANVGQNGK
jgi:trehalose 6-phosphate synthase/phosphatase